MSSQGWSVSEAAGALGVSEKTIRRHIKAGKIQAPSVAPRRGLTYRIDALSTVMAGKVGQVRRTEDILLELLRDKEHLIASLQEERLKLVSQIGYLQSQNYHLLEQIRTLSPGAAADAAPARPPFLERLLGR